jgi:DNA repair protein RAD7
LCLNRIYAAQEAGITPRTIARRAATRVQNIQEQEPAAGPSQLSNNDNRNGEGFEAGAEAAESSRRVSRRRGRRISRLSYASDDLDEDDEDITPAKKRRRTKASEEKTKGKEKKKKDDENSDSEEDAYTALSRSLRSAKNSPRPPVGSFENCAKCEKQFTVVCHLFLFNYAGVYNECTDKVYHSCQSWPWFSVPPMCKSFWHRPVQEICRATKTQSSRREKERTET